jgi:hypothetical protein
MKQINTRGELIALAQELGVRPDWHEPDEQGLTAYVTGRGLSFDNAMGPGSDLELNVVLCDLHVDDQGVASRGPDLAVVNLATLFSWAADTGGGDRALIEEIDRLQGVLTQVRKGLANVDRLARS